MIRLASLWSCVCLVIAGFVGVSAADEPRRDSFGDPLPEHAIARLGTVRFRHNYPVSEIWFFPDGRRLLTCDSGGGVSVWQLPGGRLLNRWYFPGALRFALTPDGKILAGAADDGVVLLIDPETGEIKSRLRGHATHADALAISHDSKWLASATWDWGAAAGGPREKQLRLWNLLTGKLVRTIELPDRLTTSLAFDSTGGRLFTAGGSQGFFNGPSDIRVWDIDRGTEPRSIATVPTAFNLLQVPRRGDVLISLLDAVTLAVRDPNSGQERATIKIGDLISFAVSNDGTKIATEMRNPENKAGSTGAAVWDLSSGRKIRELSVPHVPAALIKWSPDDKLLAFADERTVRVIDAVTGASLLPEREASSAIKFIAVAPGEKRLIVASEGNLFAAGIRVWEQTAPGEFRGGIVENSGGRITGLAFSKPTTLASAGTDGALKLWDVAQKKLLRTVFQGEKLISTLALNRDGRLAAFFYDDAIHLLDVETAEDRVLCPAKSFEVQQLVFSKDGQNVLYCEDRQVKERSILIDQSRNLLRSPRQFTDFAVSGDDKWLVTSRPLCMTNSRNSELVVSNRDDGNIVATIATPREWCKCPVFSPDGKMLAAGVSVRSGSLAGQSIGGALYLWRITGKQLLRLPLDSAVSSLAFTSDGQWIVTGHEDTSILIWDAAELLKDDKE